MYQFNCLPFSLSSAPWVFTKTLKPVIALLRELGVRLIAYIDDNNSHPGRVQGGVTRSRRSGSVPVDLYGFHSKPEKFCYRAVADSRLSGTKFVPSQWGRIAPNSFEPSLYACIPLRHSGYREGSSEFGAVRPHRTSSNHCDEGGSRSTAKVRVSSVSSSPLVIVFRGGSVQSNLPEFTPNYPVILLERARCIEFFT